MCCVSLAVFCVSSTVFYEIPRRSLLCAVKSYYVLCGPYCVL